MSNYNKRRRKTQSKSPKTEVGVNERHMKHSEECNINDPSWYNLNSRLSIDAGSFSYNTPLGTPILSDNNMVFSTDNYIQYTAVPGVCAIHIAPTVGGVGSPVDPINVASRSLYQYVVHANSRNTSYDPNDLMLYCLSVASAYSYLSWMKRLYGYINTYSQSNRYIPRGFAMADNVDFDDIVSNLAALRYYINNFATRLASFAIPNDLPIFKRYAFMYQNIYADDPTIKASHYMFVPDYFFKFSDTIHETGGSLEAVAFNSWDPDDQPTIVGAPPKKFANIVSYGDNMLERIFNSTDEGVISGDIRKAYGEQSLLVPETIDEGYSVIPTYEPEVLLQIHNATVWPGVEDGHVYQDMDNNTLVTDLHLFGEVEKQHANMDYDKCITLSMRINDQMVDSPSPDDVMVSTRLTSHCKRLSDGNEHYRYKITSCGSEVACGMTIVTLQKTPADARPHWAKYKMSYVDVASNSQIARLVHKRDLLSSFSYRPFVWPVVYNGTSGRDQSTWTATTIASTMPNGGLENYTIMYISDLDKLHSTALLSLFNIPNLGFTQR